MGFEGYSGKVNLTATHFGRKRRHMKRKLYGGRKSYEQIQRERESSVAHWCAERLGWSVK